MTVTVAGLPELSWTSHEGQAVTTPSGGLTLTADRGVDWSNDSVTGGQQHDATALVFAAPGSFSLSARVHVAGARSTFDAGALVLWADVDHWAKLCFEYSPQGEAMVVSVVTNGFSDDCNSTLVAEDHVFLRVSRVGAGWAFHSSPDAEYWSFVRLFRLHTDLPIMVGFLSQAPMGDTCVASFDDITLSSAPPADLRDGS